VKSSTKRCLKDFCKNDSLQQCLGPLVQDLHRVAVPLVIRGATLCALLVDCGCANGVIHPGRLELAIKNFTHPDQAKSMSLQLFASKAAGHARYVLALLCELKRHDMRPTATTSKKTIRFRKDMNVADTSVIQNLVATMKMTDVSQQTQEDLSQPPLTITHAPPKVTTPQPKKGAQVGDVQPQECLFGGE